eukprot:m.67129 g.67129  ORF g.67129 m.67129 type:complete len:63 (-) comp14075_c0_seq10:1370-1558(-)
MTCLAERLEESYLATWTKGYNVKWVRYRSRMDGVNGLIVHKRAALLLDTFALKLVTVQRGFG